MKTPIEILKQYWGFDQFRPLQEEIIQSVIGNNDTLALLPTGGGKSVCYQVPALLNEGLCLVISPLIALMKDQVEGLRRKNITAYAVYSGMSRKEVINILKVAGQSNCKFLYVSPERLETSLFKEYLPGLDIRLLAVDEAHCISQWGYDFRPVYLRIAALREELPGIPLLALTASATPDVQVDIMERLSLPGTGATDLLKTAKTYTREKYRDWMVFRQSFERSNLSYSCFLVDAKINKILEVLQKVPGSSIVYCKSRKRCREISELLQMQDISADYYHAGLTREERDNRQEAWIQDKTRVIVCTNAFGMGIDKPAVRTVIHADTPDCLENYYQEAGRAGRDGKKSYAVLLYDQREIPELENQVAVRFPDEEEIRLVYQSLANYLQLPAGDGAGQYYDFDIPDFIKKFRLPIQPVLYALKILEQEGWLSFNEQVFLPATVGFTTGKDELYLFEKEYPALEPLIKILLRTYEGIFDQPVFISEKMIAGLMRMDEAAIKKQLQELDSLRLLAYQPQKDNPRIFFLRNRIRAEELRIDREAIEKRKKRYQLRLEQLIRYIRDENDCRSRMLAEYFGDPGTTRCGTCDNCLRQKKVQITKEEFDHLSHRIINLVKYESLSAHDLLMKLSGVKKEKAWQVLELLQAEQKIEMDREGLVRLKG